MSAPRSGALVGFGGVAEHGHLPGYAAHGGFCIHSVVEPVEAGRQRAAAVLGDPARVHTEVDECLATGGIEFLDVCAPPAYHLSAIECAAAAGLHVLVEKPLALTPDEARRALAVCEAAGTALVVVHNWHHAPMFRAAHHAIEKGAIGTPREVEFITERTEPASGGGASWRLDKKIAGGGILVDHGWHQLYVARALLGGAEPERVRARIETRRWHDASVEDTADAEVEYADGGVARLRLTWAGGARRTEVIVRGEAGEIRIEGGRVRVQPTSGASRDWPVEADAPDDSYHATWFPRVLDLFAAALGDRAAAAANAREALLNQAVIDAAYRSGEAGGDPVAVEI
jgi:predicted dehydrogenase